MSKTMYNSCDEKSDYEYETQSNSSVDEDEMIENDQLDIYEYLNNSKEIDIRHSIDYILKKRKINIMYKLNNNIENDQIRSFVNYCYGNNENIYVFILSIISLLCLGKQNGQTYNTSIKMYNNIYNKLLKNKIIKNNLFTNNIDENNKINKWDSLDYKYDNLLKRSSDLNENINKLDNKFNCLISRIRLLKIKKLKEKQKKFDENLKSLEREFNEIYNKSLTLCKLNNCKNICSDDIG